MHPSTRLQLVKDGLAERVEAVGLFGPQLAAAEHMLKLTDHGKEVLERADAACLDLETCATRYKPILSKKDLELLDKASKVAIANRCKKHLGFELDSTGVKLLVSACEIAGKLPLVVPDLRTLDASKGSRARPDRRGAQAWIALVAHPERRAGTGRSCQYSAQR